VQLLLQQGADVNHTDVFGVTPLMLAKTAPAVKLLLAACADAAAVRREGSTVLHVHAQFGASTGAVCLVIKAGADPTAVDVNGSTAAHIAGIKGHFALEALLSRAADDHRKKQIASSSSSSSSGISSSSSDGGSTSSDFYTSMSNSTAAAADGATCAAGATTVHTDAAIITAISGSRGVTTSEWATAARVLSSKAVIAGIRTASSSCSAEAAAIQQKQQQQQQQQQQPPKAHKAKQPCANCRSPTSKRCRRCTAVYYCSIECQKVCFADPQHRAQCEAKAAALQ
jgi:Ankyrin repeats (3 copies)/MYND finger